MNAGLLFGSDLPTFVPDVAHGGEGRKGQCPVNFWILLLLLSISALYRKEDGCAKHTEHQNISQEPQDKRN